MYRDCRKTQIFLHLLGLRQEIGPDLAGHMAGPDAEILPDLSPKQAQHRREFEIFEVLHFAGSDMTT